MYLSPSGKVPRHRLMIPSEWEIDHYGELKNLPSAGQRPRGGGRPLCTRPSAFYHRRSGNGRIRVQYLSHGDECDFSLVSVPASPTNAIIASACKTRHLPRARVVRTDFFSFGLQVHTFPHTSDTFISFYCSFL